MNILDLFLMFLYIFIGTTVAYSLLTLTFIFVFYICYIKFDIHYFHFRDLLLLINCNYYKIFSKLFLISLLFSISTSFLYFIFIRFRILERIAEVINLNIQNKIKIYEVSKTSIIFLIALILVFLPSVIYKLSLLNNLIIILLILILLNLSINKIFDQYEQIYMLLDKFINTGREKYLKNALLLLNKLFNNSFKSITIHSMSDYLSKAIHFDRENKIRSKLKDLLNSISLRDNVDIAKNLEELYMIYNSLNLHFIAKRTTSSLILKIGSLKYYFYDVIKEILKEVAKMIVIILILLIILSFKPDLLRIIPII